MRSRFMITLTAAALLAPAVPALAEHADRGVTVFDAGDFRGRQQTFYQDVPNLANSTIGNDHASSVRVDRGCRARLYADADFRGEFVEIVGEERNLGRTRLGNDRASSLKVRCGWNVDWDDDRDRVPAKPAIVEGSGDAVLYTERGYRGSGTTLRHGTDVDDLRGTRVGSDAISSIRVREGCRVRLYADPDYRGEFVEISSDADALDRTRVGDNRTSSLKVRCGPPFAWGADFDEDRGQGPGNDGRGRGLGNQRGGRANDGTNPSVTLYRDKDYRGPSDTYRSGHDITDLRATRVGNDGASSIRVDRGCRVRLYEDAGFQGRAIELDTDVDDLDITDLRDDRVSSLQVRCGNDARSWGQFAGGRGGGFDDDSDFDSDSDSDSDSDFDSDSDSDSDDRWGDDRRGGVTLYAGGGFTGASAGIDRDVRDLGETAVGNDQASSIRIAPGCRARLYAAGDFRGDYVELSRDEDNLGRTRVGNDRASSIEVRCDQRDRWSGGDDDSDRWGDDRRGGVTLYAGGGFTGASAMIDRDVRDLGETPVGNDKASSIRVAPGCRARLYSAGDFRGDYVELSYDEDDLGRTPVGNDQASSIEIRCEGRTGWSDRGSRRGSATLYAGGDFRGVSETITDDVPDLGRTAVGNDQASSIRIDPGCTVWLYAAGDFRGEYAELTFDERDLGRTRVGNDHASSLRIRCR